MTKDESFFEKHSGKISAGGLAVNALQNQKIANHQRAVAKLQAKTAQLQHEENELKKKELELLKKEQEALEQERKRKRQLEKQRKQLTAELLDITPQLSKFLEKIQHSNYNNDIQRGQDLYEANCVLAYVNSNKDVIEDINFHDYLLKVNNHLASCNQQFQKSYNLFDNYLENIDQLLTDYKTHISAIETLMNGYELGRNYDLDNIEETLEELHEKDDSERFLLEELHEYKELVFGDGFYFSKEYVSLPISKEQTEMLVQFLINISHERFWEEEVLHRIETFRANQKMEQLAKYLQDKRSKKHKNNYAPINLSEIKSSFKKNESYEIEEKIIEQIKSILHLYQNHVKNQFKKFDPTKTISKNQKKFSELLEYIKKVTGIDFSVEIYKKLELEENKSTAVKTTLNTIMVVAFIGFIIGIMSQPSDLTSEEGEFHMIITFSVLMIGGIAWLVDKGMEDKPMNYKKIIMPYSDKVNNEFKKLYALLKS